MLARGCRVKGALCKGVCEARCTAREWARSCRPGCLVHLRTAQADEAGRRSPTSRRLPPPLADRASRRGGAALADLPPAASSTCGPRKPTTGRRSPTSRRLPRPLADRASRRRGGARRPLLLATQPVSRPEQGRSCQLMAEVGRAVAGEVPWAARSAEELPVHGRSWPRRGRRGALGGQIGGGAASSWPKLAAPWPARCPGPAQARLLEASEARRRDRLQVVVPRSEMAQEARGRLPVGWTLGSMSSSGVSSACSPRMCAIRGPGASVPGVSSACSPRMYAIQGPGASFSGVSSACSPRMCAIHRSRRRSGVDRRRGRHQKKPESPTWISRT